MLFLLLAVVGEVHVFNGTADDNSTNVARSNSELLNSTLSSLASGDVFLIPNKTYCYMGGVMADGLTDVVIQLEGTLLLSDDTKAYPKAKDGMPFDAIKLSNLRNVTLTSENGTGTLNGQGEKWWGLVVITIIHRCAYKLQFISATDLFDGNYQIHYVEDTNHRPIMLHIDGATDLLVENLFFSASPRFNFYGEGLNGVEIRNCDIVGAWPDDSGTHNIHDLSAFNTDGFDVSGNNVHIHNCRIYNQDDCIAVKKDATNMLFEGITASGLGLSIGGLGSHHNVNNITFRNVYMHKTYKGIYVKVTGSCDNCSISNVLYENITMDKPVQYPIWIGPAQQAISANPCHASPCSLCWPDTPGAQCNRPHAHFHNITLRNIAVIEPQMSPGTIFINDTSPVTGLVFDHVVVTKPGSKPWGSEYYKCKGVLGGIATGGTSPVPPCFNQTTEEEG